MPKRVVLVVIDGLTPGLLEGALEELPALRFLAEHGRLRRGTSTFPSLTPVCLSSIATGAHPDVHEIPHLVWYHRGERRLIEYGSSFAALRAAGFSRSLRDTILNMNARHLGAGAVTLFEAVEDAGLVAASVNFTAYRGRTSHRSSLPGVPPASGPRRFFFYSLYESDATGAPLAVRNRAAGSIDDYAAAVGRWLVTRDGFDVLVFYLSDLDYASHALGPDGCREALTRADAHVASLLEAAGGPDEFLDRYAVVVCADHGQTDVHTAVSLEHAVAGVDAVVVAASNRAAQLYRLPRCPEDARALAERLDGEPAAEVALFREDGHVVARREGAECRVLDGEVVGGDPAILAYPDAAARVWAALANPNAGDVLVSAAAGYEFADLAGRHHVGGGSHGSLLAGDSEVPILTVGLDADPSSIVDVAPAVLAHLGVRPPEYARPLARAA
ncbi:MAG TPA: alkaline phosphatase family protein [Gaiellaceae bacterium]|nr:alkaline phosphatase family protein [Gaiellaceae bacterium]